MFCFCVLVQVWPANLFMFTGMIGQRVKVLFSMGGFPEYQGVQFPSLSLTTVMTRMGKAPSCSTSIQNFLECSAILRRPWRAAQHILLAVITVNVACVYIPACIILLESKGKWHSTKLCRDWNIHCQINHQEYPITQLNSPLSNSS